MHDQRLFFSPGPFIGGVLGGVLGSAIFRPRPRPFFYYPPPYPPYPVYNPYPYYRPPYYY